MDAQPQETAVATMAPLSDEAKKALVAMAEKKGCDLPDLTLAEMQTVSGAITEGIHDVLGVHNSVASRLSYGGTAPVRVREQVARWKEILA